MKRVWKVLKKLDPLKKRDGQLVSAVAGNGWAAPRGAKRRRYSTEYPTVAPMHHPLFVFGSEHDARSFAGCRLYSDYVIYLVEAELTHDSFHGDESWPNGTLFATSVKLLEPIKP